MTRGFTVGGLALGPVRLDRSTAIFAIYVLFLTVLFYSVSIFPLVFSFRDTRNFHTPNYEHLFSRRNISVAVVAMFVLCSMYFHLTFTSRASIDFLIDVLNQTDPYIDCNLRSLYLDMASRKIR